MTVTKEDLNKEVKRGEEDYSLQHQMWGVNGSRGSAPLALRCVFECSVSCHRRGLLEHQFDPFLVCSLYSRVARGAGSVKQGMVNKVGEELWIWRKKKNTSHKEGTKRKGVETSKTI